MGLRQLATAAGTNVFYPLDSWHDDDVWINCTQGSATLMYPQASALRPGWRLRSIVKADPGSGVIYNKISGSEDRLNWNWRSTHPYGKILNLAYQTGEMMCDGVNDFVFMAKTHHRNVPQSQRTFAYATVGPSYNLTPESENELVVVDSAGAPEGVDMVVNISPIAHWAPPTLWPSGVTGNYESCMVWIQHIGGPRRVAICPAINERIEPNNDQQITGLNRGITYLTKIGDIVGLYIASDVIRCISQGRASQLPQNWP